MRWWASAGIYDLNFCTIANYTPAFRRETSSLTFTNVDDAAEIPAENPTSVTIRNSIVWGSFEDELYLQNNGDPTFTFSILNSLLRTKEYRAATDATGTPGLAFATRFNIVNVDPLFVRTALTSSRPDYTSQATSPALPRRAGPNGMALRATPTSLPCDLINAARANDTNGGATNPSLAAYGVAHSKPHPYLYPPGGRVAQRVEQHQLLGSHHFVGAQLAVLQLQRSCFWAENKGLFWMMVAANFLRHRALLHHRQAGHGGVGLAGQARVGAAQRARRAAPPNRRRRPRAARLC